MKMSPTPKSGCPIIDNLIINGKPINIANNTAGIDWCLECPYSFCKQRDTKLDWRAVKERVEVRELTAYCLNCHELETVYFLGDHLQETRMFKQIENNIYHIHSLDMSFKPCKLY